MTNADNEYDFEDKNMTDKCPAEDELMEVYAEKKVETMKIDLFNAKTDMLYNVIYQ